MIHSLLFDSLCFTVWLCDVYIDTVHCTICELLIYILKMHENHGECTNSVFPPFSFLSLPSYHKWTPLTSMPSTSHKLAKNIYNLSLHYFQIFYFTYTITNIYLYLAHFIVFVTFYNNLKSFFINPCLLTYTFIQFISCMYSQIFILLFHISPLMS